MSFSKAKQLPSYLLQVSTFSSVIRTLDQIGYIILFRFQANRVTRVDRLIPFSGVKVLKNFIIVFSSFQKSPRIKNHIVLLTSDHITTTKLCLKPKLPLTKYTLTQCTLTKCTLTKCTMTKFPLKKFTLRKCTLTKCTLTNALRQNAF